MEQSQLTWIANFIWGIADDVLRDLYVRGKYRDVILPMTVLRRLDSLLEPNKQAVLDMKVSLDKAGIVHQDQALRQAAGQAFYNTSTRQNLRCAICATAPVSNSSKPTLKRISMASRQTCKTSSKNSNSEIRFRASPKQTRSAR